MLLRASSEKLGAEAEIDATVGRGGSGGVPDGETLVRFAEAVCRGEDVEGPRRGVLEAVGPAGFLEAACIVGIFNGLVRTADATGIPLDDGTLQSTREFRAELGLDAYAGAANSNLAAAATVVLADDDPQKLFR